ncbi:fasciclin domain-containing protein [Schizosaccharomyces japonicus yFS275]|uniref:Fasciclin domain-containing protein n=1 Tax=Schizosaccharomyces japonicus (strain yFS275 / FY16936) TaxID=402676 RepID=B6JWF6_SCHJY|nr:fasciclin domain-containing protein [Schizosaccharomyces japonicus yFS275]EEB05707.1 fasciclin domain-containing protein [Schizosaccharomyces japonicus yFS275]
MLILWFQLLLQLTLVTSHNFGTIVPASTSIVDVLSADPKFSRLIRHLQRNRLIPFLNRHSNLTLFAPVNTGLDDQDEEPDWWYHLLDTTEFTRAVHPTMSLADDGRPIAVKSWTARRGEQVFVGGAELLDTIEARNGVVRVINKPIPKPPSSSVHLADNYLLSTFHRLSTAWIDGYESFTLLVPDIFAFQRAFRPTEIAYLFSLYATKDVKKVVFQHTLFNKRVYSDDVKTPTRFKTREGADVELFHNEDDGFMYVNGVKTSKYDYVTTNGAIHILPVVLPIQGLEFTPTKYLIGMGSSDFALLLERQLPSVANDTESERAIFAPTNWAFNPTCNLPYHLVDHFDVPKKGEYALLRTRAKRPDDSQHLLRVSNKGQLVLNFHTRVIQSDKIGGTSIFILEKDVELPQSLLPELILMDDITTNIRYIASLGLSDVKGVTWFLVANDGWDQLGLIHDVLRQNMELMHDVVIEQAIKGIHHFGGSNLEWYSGTYETYNGSLIDIHDATSYKAGKKVDALRINGELYNVRERDILVENSVVHVLERPRVPFIVSQRQMILASNNTIFLQLIEKHGLADMLDKGNPMVIPLLDEDDLSVRDTDFVQRHIIDLKKQLLVFSRGAISVDEGPWVSVVNYGRSPLGDVFVIRQPLPTRISSFWRAVRISVLTLIACGSACSGAYALFTRRRMSPLDREREALLQEGGEIEEALIIEEDQLPRVDEDDENEEEDGALDSNSGGEGPSPRSGAPSNKSYGTINAPS